jgi:molecular chaperone Hsp33
VSAQPPSDYVRPFLFEDLDVRGAFVHLQTTWGEMQAGRDYPPCVAELLGQMAAVTVLIAANLKQPGRMTFQLRGQGPVNLLVLDCDQALRLRGMVRAEADTQPAPVPELLGHGQLALTLDVAGLETPYQSLVPLDGDSLAAIFEHYLACSEQQPARLFLAADSGAAAGLFLQQLPGADQRDADGWNRVQTLAETVQARELLDLGSVQLLTRLFSQEDIRVYDPRPVRYHCPEDWDKIHQALRALGRAECESILAERGEIHLQDEICHREYRLDEGAVRALFSPGGASA